MKRSTSLVLVALATAAGGVGIARLREARRADFATSSAHELAPDRNDDHAVPVFREIDPLERRGEAPKSKSSLPESLKDLERTPEMEQRIAALDPMGDQKVDHKLRLLKYLSDCLDSRPIPTGEVVIEQWFQPDADQTRASAQDISIGESNLDAEDQEAVLECARKFNQSFQLDLKDNMPDDRRYVLRTSVVFPPENDKVVTWLLQPSDGNPQVETTTTEPSPVQTLDPNDPNRSKVELAGGEPSP